LVLLKRLDFNYLTIANGELLAQISQNRENPWISLALGVVAHRSGTSQAATTNRGNDACVDHRLKREVLRRLSPLTESTLGGGHVRPLDHRDAIFAVHPPVVHLIHELAHQKYAKAPDRPASNRL
jgi:hypothetical protein